MKAYIITGTSRGIGHALAHRALSEPAVVHGIARDQSTELEEAAERTHGTGLVQHRYDLAATEGIPDLADHILADIVSRSMAVDALVLVNNAGVLGPIGPVEDLSPHELSTHIGVNVTAAMQLTASVLRAAENLKVPKTVVNISSGAATTAYAGWSAYCTSKAAIEMFTRVLAFEHAADTEFRAVAVAPGVVDTEMQAVIRDTDESRFPHRSKFVELKETGRLSDPEKVAELILQAAFDTEIESGASVDVRTRYG
mgnify:CR=1 FL=1